MESLGDILKRLQRQNTSSGMGFPDNPSELVEESGYCCPICGGMGWLRTDVSVGHPEFGKAHPCACQQESSGDERLLRLQRISNLGMLTEKTFGTLDPNGRIRSATTRNLFRAALEEAQSYSEEPRGWLVMTGASGSGKTHLAVAIANKCISDGMRVFFIAVPDLLDHLRASFTPGAEIPYNELFEQVKNVPLLVLDDLGAHSTTSWAQEKLYQVLNHRFSLSLPTVVVLSLSMADIEDRFRTRLQDARLSKVVPVAREGTGWAGELGPLSPEMIKRMTFDSFDVQGNRANPRQRETLERALQAAKNFAKDPDGWLLLVGDSGCGKTHLAVAIGGDRLQGGDMPQFWPVPDLLDHLRYTFSPDSRITYDKVFEEVKRCPLLILDDLGAESATPWANEKLYQIIVHRQNSRVPTIITSREVHDPHSNRHLGHGERGNRDGRDPIASRLNDSRLVMVVPIDAPDYRNQQRVAGSRKSSGQSRRTS